MGASVEPAGPVAIAPERAQQAREQLQQAARRLDGLAERAQAALRPLGWPSSLPTDLGEHSSRLRRLAREIDAVVADLRAVDAAGTVVAGDRWRMALPSTAGLDELLRVVAGAGMLAACAPTGSGGARAAFAALPAARRRWLALAFPSQVGAADAAPPALRDLANRRLLASHVGQARSRLRAGSDRLGDGLAALGIDPKVRGDGMALRRALLRNAGVETYPRVMAAHARLQEGQRRLAALEGVLDDPSLQVLAFDGDADRIVLGRGRLDDASHVTAIIPGATTTIASLGEGYRGWQDRLHRAIGDRLGHDGAATVLWLDYDAPDRLFPDAVSGRSAVEAGERLQRFLEGVVAVPRASVTTVGHSYGSVVMGEQLASSGLPGDRFVALGSPGLGVQHGDALRLADHQRLLAGTLPGDPIAAVGGWNPVTGDLGRLIHGPDPRRLDGVVDLELTGEGLGAGGGPLDLGSRHGQYLDAGSASLERLADLAAGRGSSARR